MTVKWVVSIVCQKSEIHERMAHKWRGEGGSVPPTKTTKELQGTWPTYSAQVYLHMPDNYALCLVIFKQVFQQGSLVK